MSPIKPALQAYIAAHLHAFVQFLFESFLVFILYLILAYKWDSLVRVSRRANLIYPHRLVSSVKPDQAFSTVCRYLQSSDG